MYHGYCTRVRRLRWSFPLDQEHKFVDLSIHAFIKTKLDEYGRSLHDLDPTGSIFSDVHRLLMENSNGEIFSFMRFFFI